MNTRADAWGGDAAGRGRLLLEVARRASAAIGAERVGVRLSPHGVFNDVAPWGSIDEDFVSWAGALGGLGLAWLHVVDHSAMGAPPVLAALKAALRAAFGGTLILSGGYDAARAERDLAEGRGDLVAFGRPFISNPDLVERLRAGRALQAPDFSTFYTPGERGYTDY